MCRIFVKGEREKMNKLLIISLIIGVLIIGISLLYYTMTIKKPSQNNPIPTIQYDKPTGPLMQDGKFYSKEKIEVSQ